MDRQSTYFNLMTMTWIQTYLKKVTVLFHHKFIKEVVDIGKLLEITTYS